MHSLSADPCSQVRRISTESDPRSDPIGIAWDESLDIVGSILVAGRVSRREDRIHRLYFVDLDAGEMIREYDPGGELSSISIYPVSSSACYCARQH